MREMLINGKNVQLPFVYDSTTGVTYLVSHDKHSHVGSDGKFIFIELSEGFFYTLSLEELEQLISDGAECIDKFDFVKVV